MRLLVKEVLVGDDKIIIRHCIPMPNRSGDGPPDGGTNTAPPGTEGYLLRSRSHHRALRSAACATCSASIFDSADLEPFYNEAQDALVRDTVLEETDNP